MCLNRPVRNINNDAEFHLTSKLNDTDVMIDDCEYINYDDVTHTNTQGLCILHLNVRSLVKKTR